MLEANKFFLKFIFQADVEKIHLLQLQILNITTSRTHFCSCWKVSSKINILVSKVYVQHKYLCLGYASYKLSPTTGENKVYSRYAKVSGLGIILVTP